MTYVFIAHNLSVVEHISDRVCVMYPGRVAEELFYHPRRPYAQELCKQECPSLKETGPGHFVVCHFADELTLDGIGELKIKNECVGGKKDE